MKFASGRVILFTACGLMFISVVALDVLTPQRLVAAILLNVPIALSGLTFDRRATFALVIAAILTNALVGVLNASAEGGFDQISLLNRSLLAASFALVGGLTVRLTQTARHLEDVRIAESRIRYERDQERIAAIGQERSLTAALHKTAEVLEGSFQARGVILATANVNAFCEPRVAHPVALSSWAIGDLLPTKLVGSPPPQPLETDQPGEYGLTANRAIVAGLGWNERTPILLALLEPSVGDGETLAKLLPALSNALERAELTERLEVNRTELERRAVVIRDLVYAFSHDLRTPLVANGMNMRLALEGAFGQLPEAYLKTLRNGMEANEDLLSLAESLLILAKLESAEPRSPIEAVSLELAVRSSAARLPQLDHLQWRVNGESVVRGHPADLRRVIQNLLENAAKFSPAGETIEISIERTSGQVRLEIADRGAGVPVELEPRLFQRFSSGRAGGGTGLGLYLSKRIIEAHGGQIGYHPRVGGGSVFWIELPEAKSSETAPLENSSNLEVPA